MSSTGLCLLHEGATPSPRSSCSPARSRLGVPAWWAARGGSSGRGRRLEAMALAVAEKGYAGTAGGCVIGSAGVSRKTFYEHFANKEACFLEAYDAGVQVLLATIDDAVAAAPDWLRAVTDGLRAYLDTLAANPAFARTFLVEILAAGPLAIERRGAVHARFAEQIAANHRAARADVPELIAVPAHRFRACVGATH